MGSSENNKKGSLGEGIVLTQLLDKGFEILETNWRSGRYEIDILAAKNGCLHFIEVKTRISKTQSQPETNVGFKKIENLKKAAEAYLHENPKWQKIQFDVYAVWINANSNKIYTHIFEDVF